MVIKKGAQKRAGELNIITFAFKRNRYPFKAFKTTGSFVIDCRFLPNPYWEPKLAKLTGKDRAVKRYFEKKPIVEQFIQSTIRQLKLVSKNMHQSSVSKYNIYFGCTGGQHRSVYVSEAVAKRLKKLGIKSHITHSEMDA